MNLKTRALVNLYCEVMQDHKVSKSSTLIDNKNIFFLRKLMFSVFHGISKTHSNIQGFFSYAEESWK